MSDTCTSPRRLAARFGSSGVLRTLTFLLTLVLGAQALAQPAPTLSLGSYTYVVGDTLELNASNLEPGATYRVELVPPGAEGEEAAPLVSVLIAGPSGTLRYTSPLESGGGYQVHVSGPRLDATLNVRVSGPESAVGQVPGPQAPTAPPEEPDAQTDAPAEPPEVVAPDTDADEGTGTSGATGQETVGEPQTDEAETAPRPSDDTQADEGTADTTDDAVGAPTEPQTGPGEGPALPPVGDGTQTPTVPSRPLPGGASYRIVGDAVVAETATGAVLWRLDFPAGSGATAGLAFTSDRLVVGHGNHLLELSATTGQVLRRHRLPAQVTDAAFTGTAVDVTVSYSDGATRRVRVTEAGPTDPLPFDPNPALYTWLRQEANVADPAARLLQDPTNPWLYVARVQSVTSQLTPSQARAQLELAVANSATFYERAQVADALLGVSTPARDLADSAMDAALADFTARGYRSELLTSQELQDAYGFPLGRLYNALGRGNLERAGFWAEWLYRSSDGTNTEAQAALREYSLYLQEAGQRDEASLWRTRANELRGRFQVGPTIANAALVVGRTGWYGVAALLVSILALHITLLAKYWRPQSLNLQRARNNGKKVSPVMARLSFMRYATFLEKLVVVLLFAATLALTALYGWSTKVDAVPLAWGSGSLSTPAALDSVVALDAERPDALFVRGYAAQTAGDRAEAERAYSHLPEDAAALNNLAVLTGNDALLSRALELAPNHEVVLYNLGRGENPSGLLGAYVPDQQLLIAPDPTRLGGALAGTYLNAWASAFTNPWAALVDVPGITLPAWLWAVIVALFLLWALVSVLWLVTPRPRLARNAPRTFLYHLLALLLPGTGLADELWGLVLMVPWAIFGVDLLLHYLPGGPDPVIALQTDVIALVVIYALNLVAFFVELASYRRRMADLKRNDPQTAREYGMRVPTPEFG